MYCASIVSRLKACCCTLKSVFKTRMFCTLGTERSASRLVGLNVQKADKNRKIKNNCLSFLWCLWRSPNRVAYSHSYILSYCTLYYYRNTQDLSAKKSSVFICNAPYESCLCQRLVFRSTQNSLYHTFFVSQWHHEIIL